MGNRSTLLRALHPVMAMTLVGCSPSNHPAPAGVDRACEHATPSAQQFIGDWTEPGEATVTTLSGDATLTSRGQSGTWSYAPWASTPGKNSMPVGEDNQCVLWLHYQSPSPPMDLVYAPLKATNDSLELSYVGRGNTVTWVHPQPAT